MVLSVLVMSAVAVMSLSLVTTSLRSKEERKQAHEDLSAVYIAEAGVRLAAMELVSGRQGNLGSAYNPVKYGSGQFQVTSQDKGSGLVEVTSTGAENGSTATVQVLMRAGSQSPFRWAAFGDTSMTMDSNAIVDSYNSSLGIYEDQDVNGSGQKRWALENGNVGSNAAIDLSSNSVVHGSAIPGSGYAATATGNAYITGITTPASAPFVLDPLVFPTPSPSGSMAASGSATLASGDYYFDTFDVSGNSTLTITGPAVIVADSMSLSSNSSIIVDATNGPVEFWVYGDFEMNSNTLLASTTFDPGHIQVYLDADNVINPNIVVDVDVTFDSNAKLYGTITAPNSAIDIDSNFELFGSVLAKSVHLDSNSKIHFDENLLNSSSGSSSSYTTVGWRLITQ